MRSIRIVAILALLVAASAALQAQTEKVSIYDPSIDAHAEISKLVKQASAEGKHVLLQVGGNW